MAGYATVADVEAQIEGWTTTNTAALERLIERASRDVDDLLGPYVYRRRTGAFTGFKLNPAELPLLERTALARATVEQVRHRVALGEEALNTPGVVRESGPDFTIEYAATGVPSTNRYSPRIGLELEPLTYLYRVTGARARA